MKITLTKKQIFDLQTKWNIPSKFKIIGKEWWNDERYWKDVCINQSLPKKFVKEYQFILKNYIHLKFVNPIVRDAII